MTFRILGAFLALLVLVGCGDEGGNPLETPEEADSDPPAEGEEPADEGDDGAPVDSERTLPPGTSSPAANATIFRREARVTSADDSSYGNGFANGFAYDAATDTFFVDGLAFDGNQPDGQPFTRSVPGSLGSSYALYESPAFEPDSVSATQIGQFGHRVLYGVSDTGETEFAIVRVGNYVEYGFGGFIYQRNGAVELPLDGQASYTGDYGAIRDFNGAGGLEYATGDMQIDIDFGGFRNNCAAGGGPCENAVRGIVRNRVVFDADGNDISADVVAALDEENADVTVTELPVLRFRIGPDAADANGELTGDVFSTVAGSEYEAGNYYAIMAGDHTTAPGGEIVGVLVVEADDPRETGVTVRETGGFILDRQ